MLSSGHAIQTVLHFLQSTASYTLMLVFMTYNVWLCIALVLGLAVGYFFFGWRKNTVVDVNEHCQWCTAPWTGFRLSVYIKKFFRRDFRFALQARRVFFCIVSVKRVKLSRWGVAGLGIGLYLLYTSTYFSKVKIRSLSAVAWRQRNYSRSWIIWLGTLVPIFFFFPKKGIWYEILWKQKP